MLVIGVIVAAGCVHYIWKAKRQTDIRQIGILYKLMLVVLIMSVTTATVRISRGIIRHYAHEAEERLPITSLGQTAASAFLIGTAALIILNILGISIRTLRNKLKQYTDEGLSVPGGNANEESAAS